MKYVIYLDIAALVILITIAIHFMYSKQVKNQRFNMLTTLVYVVFAGSVIDIVTSILEGNKSVPTIIMSILVSIYLLCVSTVPVGYFCYVFIVCNKDKIITSKDYRRITPPYLVVLLLLFTNPFTNWIFYYDDMNVYHHGVIYNVIYFVAILYAFVGIGYAIYHKNVLGKWMRFALLIYPTSMLGVIVLQNIFPNVMMMQFAETVCVELLVFSIDNPAVYKDAEIDVFNSRAFSESFSYEQNKRGRFRILGLRITSYASIHELMGHRAGEEAANEVATFIKSLISERYLFRIEPEVFFIICEDSDDESNRLREAIMDRFDKNFDIQRVTVRMEVYMSMLVYPDKVGSADVALQMMSFALREAATKGERSLYIPDDSILSKSDRETEILRIIREAISQKSFEVYYQPVYNSKEGRFTRAEALVRLFDDDLGYISPEEFLPLAEQNGLIVEIDAIVFDKVCNLIKKEKLWLKGLEKIDLNLSAVQCMQNDLATILLDKINAYQVPCKIFEFEIAEITALNSEERLKKNMEELMSNGVGFAIDDFGAGYTNTSTIVDYPFSTVKLDRALLWRAMKNNQAMTALKHIVRMLEEMGLEIVMEGIESEEMASVIEQLGCKMHQGFYYSRPIPPEQLLAYLDV